MANNIFTSGVELTDDELKALPIDIMAVWLDMWYEAIREDEDRFNAWMSERSTEAYAEDLRDYEALP